MISKIYFWNKTLHVSDSSTVHHHVMGTYMPIRSSRLYSRYCHIWCVKPWLLVVRS